MIELSNSNVGALPGLDLQFIIEKVGQFFFASLRIGAFLLSSPLFGARFVLLPVRIGIIMTITLLIITLNPNIPNIEIISSSNGIATAFTEIAIGLAGGLILTIIFASVSLAGEKIASASGLSMAQQIDPTSGSSSPVVSQILTLFLLVVFLSLDGHLLVIRTIIDSYEFIPIGNYINPEILVEGGIIASKKMFFIAAIIMLPIVIVLLLVNVAIGVITRSAPTLNLFSFGFPITMLGVFFMLYIASSSMGVALSNLVDEAIMIFEEMMGALANG